MPRRRPPRAPLVVRAVGLIGALVLWLGAKAARRPVDSTAIALAVAASVIIVINAAFLQSGAHPMPFFHPLPNAAGQQRSQGAAPVSLPPARMAAPPSSIPAALRNDPIAQLIGMSGRIMAVQRVLSNFGYGQIRPSGIVDQSTSTAIEQFEREHGLPVTGRVSDRLVSELSKMTGAPIE